MDALQAAAETAAPSGTTLKRPAGPPHRDDRDRRLDRHGVVRRVGASVAQAGPGGAIAAYIAIGLMVYFVVTGLGEMAALMPVSTVRDLRREVRRRRLRRRARLDLLVQLGRDDRDRAGRRADRDALLVSNRTRHLVGRRFPRADLPLSVRGFGESEYWFSLIKVVTVVAFIAALLIAAGLIGNGHPVGLRNFTTGDAPFVGGVHAMMSVALIAGFRFSAPSWSGSRPANRKTRARRSRVR